MSILYNTSFNAASVVVASPLLALFSCIFRPNKEAIEEIEYLNDNHSKLKLIEKW